MDLPGILRHDSTRLVALCDLDSLRLEDGKQMVESHYEKKKAGVKVATYGDCREALRHPAILSTPLGKRKSASMPARKTTTTSLGSLIR